MTCRDSLCVSLTQRAKLKVLKELDTIMPERFEDRDQKKSSLLDLKVEVSSDMATQLLN